ncbi:hypothetical protein K443DRAFT_684169 [Laccaria amethystina LaAM-08-1]|uniref:Uncharacterized protein n=1 Tax=Laccaria amethystina LaAM-08-1 TaxID=1095629 RepID=A0A0C9WJ11_9AGAR|nr:hypothetical protein K443DRAFT_684169 [Laccaria amethystina LaAM-08-1]
MAYVRQFTVPRQPRFRQSEAFHVASSAACISTGNGGAARCVRTLLRIASLMACVRQFTIPPPTQASPIQIVMRCFVAICLSTGNCTLEELRTPNCINIELGALVR